MEGKAKEDKKSVEDVEIDAFDLLNGKMKNIAIERLRKQIHTNQAETKSSDLSKF